MTCLKVISRFSRRGTDKEQGDPEESRSGYIPNTSVELNSFDFLGSYRQFNAVRIFCVVEFCIYNKFLKKESHRKWYFIPHTSSGLASVHLKIHP